MDPRLAGRVAIVTGAGRGIGEAIAHRFASEGARVVITDLDVEAAQQTATAIAERGGEAVALHADASSVADAQRTVAATLDTFGALHILVNNAGLHSQDSSGTPHERWDRGVEMTLSSAYRQTAEALEALTASGSGVVLNICSIAGNRVGTVVPWYDAAKAGIGGLTRHLAVTYGPFGLRANALCLGLIETRRTEFIHADPDRREAILQRIPLRRVGQPNEAAAAAAFLVSDDASLVSGQILIADGGMTSA